MPVNNLSTSPQLSWTQKFFARFIAAHSSIEAADERQRAELITALSLSFSLIIFIGILLTLMLTGWNLLVAAGLLFVGVSSATYWLSRGTRYTLATRVFIGGFTILAYAASFSGEHLSLFIILTFSILFLLTNLLERKWMAWVIIVNTIVVILTTLLFFPQLKGAEALNTYAGIITLGLFVLLFAWQRESLERLRLDEILTSQAELEKSNLALQKAQSDVRKRFSELQLAAQVGRTVSQVNDLDSTLTQATSLIQGEFDLYYVQIYLTNKDNTRLTLESGTGDVGDQLLARNHSLLVNAASINGRAALEKKPVVIADTEKSTTFRKNPLLPNTRGEMAIPLVVGNEVIGVLDMQSVNPNDLTEESLPAFEALAGQLAVAIQNAQLLTDAEQARAEIEALARRQIRSDWEQHLDGIYKPEAIGFSFDRNEIKPLAETLPETPADGGLVLASPITWIGEKLGSLSVEIDDHTDKAQTSELVHVIARQVAQQIESLRLLEEAERYRREAEEVSHRQTRAGWEAYIQAREGKSLSYLYNSTAVIPFENEEKDGDELSLPLRARNEEVGKLAVKGIAADDEETLELAQAVAERLSAQIENLRLAEQTRNALTEIQRSENALREISTLQTAILEGAPYAIISTTPEGIFTSFNKGAENMLGYRAEEVVGKVDPGVLHIPEEVASRAKMFSEELNQEIEPGFEVFAAKARLNLPNEYEWTYIRKDGSQLPVLLSVTAIREAENEITGFIGIAIDITERKKAEEALQKSQEQIQTLMDNITLPMIVTRLSDNVMTYINQPLLKITGFEQEEVVNKPAPNFYYKKEARAEIIAELQKSGRVDNVEVQLMHKGGSTFWALLSARIFKYQDAPSILTTIVDITERKKAEEALRESQERAQTILESITLPMVITRISTNTYSFVNQLAADAVGLSIDQMVGSPVIDFYAHPKEREEFASQLRNEGHVDNMQMQLKRKNGKTFWALLSARVFTYEGAPSILTTVVDISERIVAQEAMNKRAAELATVAKISTQVTSLHETEEILHSIVDLAKENFELYHAHIYMLDETRENLVLAAGAGEAGAKMVAEGWQIPLSRERSLVARAAREKQGVIVNNVREEEGFMANPLLPNTAAELAVPLIVGNTVLGVLDIQSNQVDYFTEADLNIQTTLAAQIAVAIQNARSFQATQEQAEYEAKINLISQRIQGTTNVEEALQVAVRELGRALGAKQASIQLDASTKKR